MIATYLIFLALLAAITCCCKGLVAAATSGAAREDTPVYTLSLLLGLPLFLFVFALIARVVPPYELAMPLALLTLLLLGRIFLGHWERPFEPLRRTDRLCLLFFALLFAGCYALRTQWPALHWENSVQRIGVERMFNVALQQSFLRGNGWPVENLWLAGEPLDYHVLLRVFPALVSRLVYTLANNPLSGGISYLLSDALYLSLAPTALLAIAVMLLPTLYPSINRKLLARCAIVVAILCFATPNAPALWKGLTALITGNGSADFWALQHAVVPGTVNYYPFGLLLSGENHSYAQAPFLSVAWVGMVAMFVALPKQIARTVVIAVIAAAIAVSHPATAMVCALAGGPLLLWGAAQALLARRKESLVTLLHLCAIPAIAALCLIPTYFEHLPPQMKWVMVSKNLASGVLPFAAVHLVSFLLLGVVALGVVVGSRFAVAHRQTARVVWLQLALVVAASLCFIDRPIVTFVILVAGISAIRFGRERPLATCFVVGALLLWVLPEFAVTDWVYDNRTDWVRFNTVMRLWLESTYLLPLALLTLGGPELFAALGNKRFRRGATFVTTTVVGCVLLANISLTHARMERAPEAPSVDGFSFLEAEAPVDMMLVRYLSKLPGRVVLGEICGDGSHEYLPYHYGRPGRISAFSGRPSLCGWARHTWMFQQKLRKENVANETVWQSFLSYNIHYKNLLQAGAGEVDRRTIEQAIRYLKQRGVTHLVIGELERALYPMANPQGVAQAIGGRLLFAPVMGVGVIEMPLQ